MGCQKTYRRLRAKVQYTELMQLNLRKNCTNFFIITALMLSTAGCELLQKRDIKPEGETGKGSRNFNVIAYVFSDQFAISESSDGNRNVRNALSSITSAALVTSKDSTFRSWHEPQLGCLPVNTSDLTMKRVHFNMNMGAFSVMSEATQQSAEINVTETNVGPTYGAYGWLPANLYTWSTTGASAPFAWSETGMPTLDTGSQIDIWSEGHWVRSASPDLDLNAKFLIETSINFAVRYRAPAQTSHVILEVTDGSGNFVTCYGSAAAGLITVPAALLASLNVGPHARLDLKFQHTRLTTTHPKFDEIFVQSSSRHVFGRMRLGGDNPPLDFGEVELVRNSP